VIKGSLAAGLPKHCKANRLLGGKTIVPQINVMERIVFIAPTDDAEEDIVNLLKPSLKHAVGSSGHGRNPLFILIRFAEVALHN